MLAKLDENLGTLDPSYWHVRVDCQSNPGPQFDCQEITKFFRGCVGAVVGVTEHIEMGRKWFEVAFRGEDELKKALCVSGSVVGNACIQVTSLPNRQYNVVAKQKSKSSFRSKRESDSRRNLYVLNLPHDLSAQEYRDLFIPHGTPTHTVLLKTQDSCSRRRGFVVMSTHEEAKNVIRWLDGVCLRGFQLRVTWANIDRSNGFMSGYDRTAFLGHNSSLSSDRADLVPASSLERPSDRIAMDTSTIVASNIPVSLFPEQEIDCLFKPFGPIKSIKLIPPNSSPEESLSTIAPESPLTQTAIVTYEYADDAISAKNKLHGQVYEGFALAVGFVSNIVPENPRAGSSLHAPSFLTRTPLIHDSAPFSSLGKGSLAPVLTVEESFRGLPRPVDFHAAPSRIQYGNQVVPLQFTHDNWTCYQPLLQHAYNQQVYHSPSQDIPVQHPLHQNSRPHYLHSFEME